MHATAPHTKIVATIGPATAAPERLDALLDAGINVARLNCAHSAGGALRAALRTLRRRADERAVPLAILADLAGPKLRLGRFAAGAVELQRGARFTLTAEAVSGTATRASVNFPGLPQEVHTGDEIFLNDGLVRAVVTGVTGAEVHTRVEVGGTVSDMKGISVPAAAGAGLPSMTAQDWANLDVLAAEEIDYVGLSFVRSADDIAALRRGLAERGHCCPVVAKIEKAQAVSNLEAIVGAADAVMVARGDLGVECPIETVPVLQKRIIAACVGAGVPVITATQMLESMVEHPRPTRAEASDVANAVLDGTDAVMLSAETATGRYPAETVQIMRRIIANSESFARTARCPDVDVRHLAADEAVGRSAALAAEAVRAEAILCLTLTGASALRLARWRPRHPVLAVTPRRPTWRRLALVRGITPILLDREFGADFDRECRLVIDRLRQCGALPDRGAVVITAGLPFTEHRHSNTMRIETI